MNNKLNVFAVLVATGFGALPASAEEECYGEGEGHYRLNTTQHYCCQLGRF